MVCIVFFSRGLIVVCFRDRPRPHAFRDVLAGRRITQEGSHPLWRSPADQEREADRHVITDDAISDEESVIRCQTPVEWKIGAMYG